MDKPKVGTRGIHGAYHLTSAEKEMLQQELRDYLTSRFAGRPCPSCFWDVLRMASFKHALDTLRPDNPDMNSGVAGDFYERSGGDIGRNQDLGRWARTLANEHADYEEQTGEFKSGGKIGDEKAGWDDE